MDRAFLFGHGLCVFLACCFFGLSYAFPPRVTHVDPGLEMAAAGVRLFAGLGALTGIWLMAKRKGKSESWLLAASTLITVFVLIMSL